VNAEEGTTTIVYVCAGVYVIGDLLVDAPVTIFGAQWNTSGQEQSSAAPATYLVGNITYLPGATSGDVQGVNLHGSATGGPEIWAPGVGSNWNFIDNVIDTTTGGILLNTDGVDGVSSSIENNEFWQAESYTVTGNAWAGLAVDLAGGSTADNVDILGNDFLDLSGVYGDIYTPGPSTCATSSAGSNLGLGIGSNTYEENTSLTTTGNSFVNLVCTTEANVYNNTLTVTDANDENAVSPIFLGGGDVDPYIQSNVITEVGGLAAFAAGIEFNSDAYPVDSPYIYNNTVSGFGEGIYGYGGDGQHNTAPSDFTISQNTISGSLVGVALYDVDGAPNAGSITGNTISNSTLYDCVDQSSGSANPQGTANSWTLNDASSSNPAGLCATNVVTPGAAPAVAYAGGSGYTPTATATSGDTTTANPPHNTISVSVDASSTGCYIASGVVGYSSSGTCVLDFNDPGYGIYGPASAQQSFNVGPGTTGGAGSGAAPASTTSVTLTFNSEGGTSEPSDTVTSGTSVTLPTPTLTGDTFLGWFTAASGGTLVTSPYVVTASTTLYAQWESNSASPASTAFHYAYKLSEFVFGSSVLTPQLKTQIGHLVVLFNAHTVVHVALRGNATLPVNAFNENLSKARALAVAAYMKSLGIHANLTISSSVSGATYDYTYLAVYVTAS